MAIRDITPFGLRIPTELKEKLQRSANENGKSLNSEILGRLVDSFSPHPNLHLASTSELISELIDRNEPGRIVIEITKDSDTQ